VVHELEDEEVTMRVLVCGGREWTDKELIKQKLSLLDVELVIEGECRGADLLGREAAEELHIEVKPFPAKWAIHGRAAGHIRNQQMLTEGKPHMVLAFHDNIKSSKGTKDMITRALKAGIPTWLVSHNQEVIDNGSKLWELLLNQPLRSASFNVRVWSSSHVLGNWSRLTWQRGTIHELML